MDNVVFKKRSTGCYDALGGDGNTYWEIRLTKGDVSEFDYPATLDLEFGGRTNGDSCSIIRIHGIESGRLDEYIFALSQVRDILHAKELVESAAKMTNREIK